MPTQTPRVIMGDRRQLPDVQRGTGRQTTRLQMAVTEFTTLENAHTKGDLTELALAEVSAMLNLLEKEALSALFEEAMALHTQAEAVADDIDAAWTEQQESLGTICKHKAKCVRLLSRSAAAREQAAAAVGQADAQRPGVLPQQRLPAPVIVPQREVLRLPQHELPKFSGLYTEWPSFWNQFYVAIGRREKLSHAHKLSHLKMCLSGEPLDIVKLLPITDQHYATAKRILQLRFEDSDMIFREVMESLLGTPSVQPNSLPSMRKLLNTFTEKLEALKHAGANEGFIFLTHIILRNLDAESRKGSEQYSTGEKRWRDLRTTTGVPDSSAATVAHHGPFDRKLAMLMNFLVSRVQIWERATGGVSNTTQSARPVKTSSPDILTVNPDPPLTFMAGLSVNVPHSSGPPPLNQKGTVDACPQCRSEDHTNLQRCPSILQFGELARHEAVKRHTVCFNCQPSAHKFKDCSSQFVCKYCKKKRHVLLHRALQTPGGAALEQSDAKRPSSGLAAAARAPDNAGPTSGDPTPSAHLTKGAQVFLCTIQIHAANKECELTTLRAMLNDGSQVEMISKTSADRQGWDIYGQSVSIRGIGGGEQRTHGQTDFIIMLQGGVKYKLTCHLLHELVGELSTTTLPASFMKTFQNYTFADSKYHTASHIDVLIGMSFYNDFVLIERTKLDHLWLLHTVLGWAVTVHPVKGKARHPTPSVLQMNRALNAGVCHNSIHYSPLIAVDNELMETQRFWATEERA